MSNGATINNIKNRMPNETIDAISRILDYFLKHNEWMPIRALHKHYGGKEQAENILAEAGGTVVFKNKYASPQTYQLTLLGVLITKKGDELRALIAKYLKFAKEKAYEEPKRTHIHSSEIADALGLNKKQIRQMGWLVRYGWLSDGGSFSQNEWRVRLPKLIEEVSEDANAFLSNKVANKFNPSIPLEPHYENDQERSYWKKVSSWLISNAINIIGGVLITVIAGYFLIRMEHIPGYPLGIVGTETPTVLVKTPTVDITQIPTGTVDNKIDKENKLFHEVNRLAKGEWEILISEDFTSKNLGPEWRELYKCDYGQFFIDNGKLNINISTKEQVSLAECVVYPSTATLKNEGQLKIFIEYLIEDSTQSNGWLGMFTGCAGENIEWLSIAASKDGITAQTLKDYISIANNLDNKGNRILVIDYNNGYVKGQLLR